MIERHVRPGDPVLAEPVGLYRPPSRSAPGRVCAEPDCTTRLSIYATGELCWQHQPRKFWLARGERRRKHVIDA